ncbi:MAG: hypothetical protein ACFUZC_23100 [Chthoniobacteraceae bacterium]
MTPPADCPLAVTSFDHWIVSLLEITSLASADLEIHAVHVDAGFPLLVTVENGTELFTPAEFPLRIARGTSISFLLRAPAASERVQRFCYGQDPTKIVVSTPGGLLVFGAE